MEIISGLHNLRDRHRGCVLTIGNFDGVHRGHQHVIAKLCEQAAERNLPSALMTFEPQPREFFAGTQLPARLTRFREKVCLLRQTGLQRLLCLPFNTKLSNVAAQWFAEDLIPKRLGASHVVVGDDFRFGRGREGDFQMLVDAGAEMGYTVSQMDTLQAGADRISSTLVRESLSKGDFAYAQTLLGHEYFIMGRVVFGRQLGRQLGVPTANIRLQRYRAALEGVYCVTVSGVSDDPTALHHGVANIGVRPTVDGKEPLLEVHLLNYSGDLYGRLLSVTFKHKLRAEQAFGSLDALQVQLDTDIREAHAYFHQ